MKSPQLVLKETFGYDTFRPLQREIIENVLARRDTLAIMPTGGGKSLCYQIPALLFEGLTVVVSPLISLMKDQVEQLRAAGVAALFLNSSLSYEEYQTNVRQVRTGQTRLLYVAPETLLTDRLLALLAALRVDCLTIDEAHCISEWGHDFRPEYRQLAEVRAHFPAATCLALTATATERVRADIKTSLGFEQSNEFVASFNRENLFIEVSPKLDAPKQAVEFLERFRDQSGIIYCLSRKQVDGLADYLIRKGWSARPYHAGLDDAVRRQNQEAFIRDDVQIIVATVAFGMGINKPNVRFILHYDLPKSIESYYQEIGRAGRDGLPAHCLLLYTFGDVAKVRWLLKDKEGAEKEAGYQHLDAMVRYAENEVTCRRKPLLEYFGETYEEENCGSCDTCAGENALEDITIPAQKFLSCVKRTGERFGAGHIAQVLRGSQTERIAQLGHDQLSTFGIGADMSSSQWMHLARQLVQTGYLAEQDGRFPTLCLTPKAADALKNRLPIMGRIMEMRERRSRRSRAADAVSEYDHELFDLLRARRKELADESRVPPYVILSDRSLVEMAVYFPQSMERMLDISGIGQVKARQYGEVFLRVIRGYCQEHGIAEGQKEVEYRVRDDTARRYMMVGEAFNAGESVEALMKRYNVSIGTILEHLTRYANAGNSLRSDGEFEALSSAAPDQKKAAFAAFDELGTIALKPVFDRLGGALSYDELRILRLGYLTRS